MKFHATSIVETVPRRFILLIFFSTNFHVSWVGDFGVASVSVVVFLLHSTQSLFCPQQRAFAEVSLRLGESNFAQPFQRLHTPTANPPGHDSVHLSFFFHIDDKG